MSKITGNGGMRSVLVLVFAMVAGSVWAEEPRRVLPYFGGAANYDFTAFTPGFTLPEKEGNKYQNAVAGRVFGGLSIYSFDLGLEVGVSPHSFYDDYVRHSNNGGLGSNYRIRPQVSFTSLPVELNVGYNLKAGSFFSFRPNVNVGAQFDFMNSVEPDYHEDNLQVAYAGREARTDINLSAGVNADFIFTFGGDRMSFLLSGGADFIIPLVGKKDGAELGGGNYSGLNWYVAPRISLGLIIHPMTRGSEKSGSSSRNTPDFIKLKPSTMDLGVNNRRDTPSGHKNPLMAGLRGKPLPAEPVMAAEKPYQGELNPLKSDGYRQEIAEAVSTGETRAKARAKAREAAMADARAASKAATASKAARSAEDAELSGEIDELQQQVDKLQKELRQSLTELRSLSLVE